MNEIEENLKSQVVALKRTIKSQSGRLKHAERKAKIAKRFVGADKLVQTSLSLLRNVKIKNLTISDTNNLNMAISTLEKLSEKVESNGET